jgi:hypothetical protein
LNAGDPGNIVWGGEGTAYSAATLAYSTVMNTGLADPLDDLTGAVLSAPDPVTLELTTYETADQAQMTGGSMVNRPGFCRGSVHWVPAPAGVGCCA